MIECSYHLNTWMTSKGSCIKCHAEAHLEDLGVENTFRCIPRKDYPICRECQIQKRKTFFRLMA